MKGDIEKALSDIVIAIELQPGNKDYFELAEFLKNGLEGKK